MKSSLSQQHNVDAHVVLWGGGAIALLHQLRVQCFVEWCWHGRAEKLRGDSAVSGKGRGWCLALLGPQLPDPSFGRDLLMEVTQEAQRGAVIVPVGPRWCRSSDPMCETSFDVYDLEQERWLRWDICQLSIQWELQGRSQPVGGTRQGSEWGGPASPAMCHSAAAFWGGQNRDHSLPGWDPSCHHPVSGPTSAPISCRISLCYVLLWT